MVKRRLRISVSLPDVVNDKHMSMMRLIVRNYLYSILRGEKEIPAEVIESIKIREEKLKLKEKLETLKYYNDVAVFEDKKMKFLTYIENYLMKVMFKYGEISDELYNSFVERGKVYEINNFEDKLNEIIQRVRAKKKSAIIIDECGDVSYNLKYRGDKDDR